MGSSVNSNPTGAVIPTPRHQARQTRPLSHLGHRSPLFAHDLFLLTRRNARHLPPRRRQNPCTHITSRRRTSPPLGRSDPRPRPESRREALHRHQHRRTTTPAEAVAAIIHRLANLQRWRLHRGPSHEFPRNRCGRRCRKSNRYSRYREEV